MLPSKTHFRFMKFSRSVSFLALILGVSTTSQAVIVTTVTGIYDEPGQGNSVDVNFATSPTARSGTGPAPTLLTASAFSSLVATAYASGLGGVINFDDIAAATGGQTQIDAKYGPGNSLIMSITGSTYTMDMGATAAIGATPISGSNYLRLGNPSINFIFSAPVAAFGFTIVGRLNARDAGLTITYSDNTTVTYANFSVGASGNASSPFVFSNTSAGDTFFGFQAPEGLAINRVAISSGGNNPTIDDFGFIIPEPSSVLLSGLGIAGLLILRRR